MPPDSLAIETTPGLIDSLGTGACFEVLHGALLRVADFQNFIVLFFEAGRTTEILHTNLDPVRLRQKMQPYLNGLYELDPFFIAALAGEQRTFIVMDEVAPEEFTQTEFYKEYYTTVGLLHEARFMVPVREDSWIHVLLERERPAPKFSETDQAAFRAVSQVTAALVRKHYEFSTVLGTLQPLNRALSVSLVAIISRLRSGALSPREVEIAEGLLQGHSPKSIARHLAISVDTVINHKRHIYEKLDVHSQAQLFNLVLEDLFGAANVIPATAPGVPVR